MTTQELVALLDEHPFRPLRLHLADGRTREILRREMVLASEMLVAVGVPRDDHSKVAKKFTYCQVSNIVEVEPFEIEKPGNGNGEKRPKKGRGR